MESLVENTDDITPQLEIDRGYSHSAEAEAEAYARQVESRQKPSPAPVETVEESGGDIGFFRTVGDMFKGAVAGPLEATKEAMEAVDSLGNYLNEKFPVAKSINEAVTGNPEGVEFELPDIAPDVETGAGEFTKGVTQFLTGFFPAYKALKAKNVGTVAAGLGAGAVSDAIVFDPNDPNLTTLLNEVPVLQEAVPDFLATDPNDSEALNRLRRSIEGLGLGYATEKVLANIFKAYRANKNTRENNKELNDLRGEGKTVEPSEVIVDQAPVVKVEAEKIDSAVDEILNGKLSPEQTDINTSTYADSQSIRDALDKTSDVFADNIDEAKRGTVPLKETQRIGEEMGLSIEQVNKLYNNTKGLDSRFHNAKIMLADSSQRLMKLAELAQSGNKQALVAVRRQMAVHAGIQAEVKGTQTEIARALNAMKIVPDTKELDQLLERFGGVEVTDKLVQHIVQLKDDPIALNAFVRKSAFAKTADSVFEVFVNSILSGPATQAVNIIGNGSVAVTGIAERYVAAAWGAGRRALTGASDGVTVGEANANLYGAWMGLKDALRLNKRSFEILTKAGKQAVKGDRAGAKQTLADNADEFGNAYRTLATEEPVIDNAVKFEHHTSNNAISAENWEVSGTFGKAVDVLGNTVRLSGRALLTGDELFKSVGYRMELHSLAYRRAQQQGFTGDALNAEIRRLIENPPKDIHLASIDGARYQTFTKSLGDSGKNAQRWIASTAGARYIAPFVRTPVNIIKYVGERTPVLKRMSEAVNAEYAAGGARGDIARARTSTGATLYFMGGMLAKEEKITGSGPVDPSVKEGWSLDGRKPYSIKIGNKWYAYNRLDPLGAYFGISADLMAMSGYVGLEDGISEEEFGELASAAVIAISKNVVNKTYLSGVTDAIEALSDPDRYGKSFINKFPSAFVPNLMAQANRTTGTPWAEADPAIREVWTVIDGFKSKISGLSQTLHPRRDLFGEPVHYEGGYGPDIMSPAYSSTQLNDPVRSEIARLEVPIRRLSKTIEGVTLKPDEYDLYARLSGEGMYDNLKALINDSSYKEATDDMKRLLIRELISDNRTIGAAKMQDPKGTHSKETRDLRMRIDQSLLEAAAELGDKQSQDKLREFELLKIK